MSVTTGPNYRFAFHITDQTTGDTLIEDYVSFDTADQFGGCETIDHAVARMLRMFVRKVRGEYETENYPENQAAA